MPLTVLIVDDHEGFRQVARALLEAAGIRVVGEAADGESAITEAERLRPQLVLLDVQLPGIDGFEVAARLGQASDLPAVVLTSSHAASSYRRRLARSPARAFIPKDELSVGDYIHHLAVSHTSSFGLFITQTTETIVDHNVISDPGITAVALFSSAEALVASNVASGSTGYAMFLVHESNSLIQQNTLTSGGHGFAIGGAGNVVRSNVVTNSGGSIDVFDGSTSTRVEFNRLSDVGDGVIVGVASGTVVEHNVVSRTGGNDRGGFGVILDGSAGTTVDQNTIDATGPGIYVAHLDAAVPPTDTRITRNVTTSKNADGILVDPDATGTLLSHNLAVRSGDDGIGVRAPGTTVTLNIANANHNLGISAAPGVIDGGGNRAAGNGSPAQCTNIVCA